MPLREVFDSLIERAQKVENDEKYHHLMLSPEKSGNEEEILNYVDRIRKNLDMLEGTISTDVDAESLTLNTKRVLKVLKELFDKDGWA